MLIVGQAYHSCLAALDNAASNHPEADLIMRVYLDFVMK